MARHEIGSYLYLFTRSNLGYDHYSDEVVISSHGGCFKSDTEFILPHGPEYRFYADHGAYANQSDLICMVNSIRQTKQGGDPCVNYRLSKFQGRHGTAEGKVEQTYDDIRRGLDASEARVAEHNERLAELSSEQLTEYRLGIQGLFDVATVRNRWQQKEVTLKYVIDQLQAKHAYRVVHCSFCREVWK